MDDNMHMPTLLACGLDFIFGDEKQEKVISKVKKEWNQIFASTNMFALKKEDVKVDYKKKLGDGGFCDVFECHVRNGYTNKFNESLPPFAIKQLRVSIVEDPEELKLAYEDLIHEAKMLRSFEKHPHIIDLIGSCDSKVSKEDAFVIVEKLESTLQSKLKKWAQIRRPFQKFTPKQAVMLRVKHVALQIAAGLNFLHSKYIIYRDLKPANIGFDHVGKVKIFDLGLAVVIPPGNACIGQAGTMRYMAPEMKAKNGLTPYTNSVDVYSFAILLWEIITSRCPFEKELPLVAFGTPKDLPDDLRPSLKHVESTKLSTILENCWHINAFERWNFDKIIEELLSACSELVDTAKAPKKKSKKGFISRLNNY